MRDDHVFEGQLEEFAQCGQGSLLVPGRCPDAQLTSGRSQRVSEDNGTLLWQPERCLFAAPSVVKCEHSSRKLASRLDGFESGLGYVIPKEESWSIGTNTVAVHEQVHVPNVVRLEHDDRCRRARIKPLPHVSLAFWRSKRVEHQSLAL